MYAPKGNFEKFSIANIYLIWSHLPACMLLLIGLALFYTQGVFV